MIMKIGILTFHRAVNNGAILQAYALKKYLENVGHRAEIIDYWPDGHEKTYELIGDFKRTNNFIKDFVLLLLRIISYSRAKVRTRKMRNLCKKMFAITDIPKYKTADSLAVVDYDCIIYGSDQIWWNSIIPTYLGYDAVYWGEYVPACIKKIAYAPSMRQAVIEEDDKTKIASYLKNFTKISARETEVARIISPLANKDVPVVLDPVFLLSKEEWATRCETIEKEPYILYYNLLESKSADAFVEKISKQRGVKIVELTGYVHPFKFGKNVNQTADAFEFISLIKNAEVVVTSSFHGVAFSVLFEKEFYAVGLGQLSGRVYSLLKMLNIEERLIHNNVSDVNAFAPIDYDAVRCLLNEKRKDSINFLNDIC